MKREKAAKVLGVTGQTVVNWAKADKIKRTRTINGQYNYDDESVYRLAAQIDTRLNVIYCRAAYDKQSLEEQQERLESFCTSRGWEIHETVSDLSTDINLDKRRGFIKLLELIESNRVKRVIIADKSRLSQTGFEMFERLFKIHGTEIIIEAELQPVDSSHEEVLNEIISLLASYNIAV